MGAYKYIREAWKKPKANPEFYKVHKDRLIKWKKEPVSLRIDRPTRLDRARSLGYKAKPGFIIIRQRVDRGGRQRAKVELGGRRPKRSSRRKDLKMSYQIVAEQRAAEKHVNCEVLNSYFVAKDGLHYWYEVILIDKSNPSILADKNINWTAGKQHRSRVSRGLTSAGRKSRGLRHKGKGAEKMRPSLRANLRKAK